MTEVLSGVELSCMILENKFTVENPECNVRKIRFVLYKLLNEKSLIFVKFLSRF